MELPTLEVTYHCKQTNKKQKEEEEMEKAKETVGKKTNTRRESGEHLPSMGPLSAICALLYETLLPGSLACLIDYQLLPHWSLLSLVPRGTRTPGRNDYPLTAIPITLFNSNLALR